MPLTSLFAVQSKPLLIAGPCGAESMQQLESLVLELKKIPSFNLLRAGVWKPRTRPTGFQGYGVEALSWLQEIRKRHLIPVAVEVATPHHVEEALKHHMDVLWIGARTTVNPLVVQDIVSALSGVNIPVLIKNPIHPDVKLWIGAVERFLNSGITQLAAVHRGFYSYTPSVYRNPPHWAVALDFKTQFPQIPLYVDPSHICGNRTHLLEISQEAFNLGYQGLMIETHPNPEKALSDSEQQISPDSLIALWNKLVVRNPLSMPSNRLSELRKRMDEQDRLFFNQLAERFKWVAPMADVKKEMGQTIFQLERWREILLTRTQWAEELGLSAEFVQKLCQLIHDESIRLQQNQWNQDSLE